jgi:hypothetical protein
MTTSLDLTILPLVQSVKSDQPVLPGLHLASPPRRSARGRHRDNLILYFSFSGNAPLNTEQTYELLSKLTETYYKTAGSVTTAQRAVAESLNDFLLNRNLRAASSGQQLIGFFTQAVLRDSRIYIAQSGPVHAFLITATKAEHIYDPYLAGRGIGLSRTTSIRFSQADLKPNDALIIAPQVPSSWTTQSLATAHREGPEYLRRRLLGDIGPRVSAALIQALPGEGKLRMLRPVKSQKPIPTQAPTTAQPTQTSTDKHSPLTMAGVATTASIAQPSSSEAVTPPEKPKTTVAPTATPHKTRSSQAVATPSQASTKTQKVRAKEQSVSIPSEPKPPSLISTKLSVAKTAFASGLLQFINWLTNISKQILPDESIFTIPPGTMAIIAIAVPIIMVVGASMVYFQRGRAAQFDILFQQAVEQAKVAESSNDPNEQRIAWDTALAYLDQAEAYQSTSDSEALRVTAINNIDNLNVIDRLDFKPALTRSLNEDSKITRMVTTGNDLYLLNASEGIVLRTTLSSKGYVLDTIFECGPGPYQGYIVGALIDIAALPSGNEMDATILGIDASGNLLYCAPGVAPTAGSLTQDPLEWGPPRKITINMGDLYVLDPQSNAVWIYRGMNVSQQPQRFFNGQIPSLEYAIDLAVNNNTLYVLHADSHITTCEFGAISGSPTRCEDPAPFADPRKGLESGPLVFGAQFNEILFLPPPDPSIFLLDPIDQAVYHFSVQLAYQRQFRSQNPQVGDLATSFTINRTNLIIFVAIGDQVYYANLP